MPKANSLESLKAKLDPAVVMEAGRETEAMLQQLAVSELREASPKHKGDEFFWVRPS